MGGYELKPGPAEVVVAGVICLDVIPKMERLAGNTGLEQLFIPGKLVNIGAAVTATGGAVPNTGLALHRLGVPVQLMGKIGDDLFGRAVADSLNRHAPGMASSLIVSTGEMTSYTIVISPPGVDRVFMHCSGANDTFAAADVPYEQLQQARLFHFGYPPLMKKMYIDGGEQLAEMFRTVKGLGLTTSLDMAKPDPDSPAGRIDWVIMMKRVLSHVDVFLPSFEELLFMLDRNTYDNLADEHGPGQVLKYATGEMLSAIADQLLEMGAAIVGIKLGEHGLYVKTTSDPSRMRTIGACWQDHSGPSWTGIELIAPCYAVEVVGTTGAGDCTIAGFIAGLLQGLPMERVALGAVAVGACNVEQADATSGVSSWEAVTDRMAAGWAQRGIAINLSEQDWQKDASTGLYFRNDRPNARG